MIKILKVLMVYLGATSWYWYCLYHMCYMLEGTNLVVLALVVGCPLGLVLTAESLRNIWSELSIRSKLNSLTILTKAWINK